jgi:hypothetical protein
MKAILEWYNAEKKTKESRGKEENHVDVSTSVGTHSRRNGTGSTSRVPERNVGDAAA